MLPSSPQVALRIDAHLVVPGTLHSHNIAELTHSHTHSHSHSIARAVSNPFTESCSVGYKQRRGHVFPKECGWSSHSKYRDMVSAYCIGLGFRVWFLNQYLKVYT